MLRTKSGFMLIFLWLGLVSLGAGCDRQAGEPQVEPDMQRLEQRVVERWSALTARDYDKVWEYNTPNYRRIFAKGLYSGNFSYAVVSELTEVELVNYDAAAAVASVAVRVMSKPVKQTSSASRALGALPKTINEKWLFIDGEWWYSANG